MKLKIVELERLLDRAGKKPQVELDGCRWRRVVPEHFWAKNASMFGMDTVCDVARKQYWLSDSWHDRFPVAVAMEAGKIVEMHCVAISTKLRPKLSLSSLVPSSDKRKGNGSLPLHVWRARVFLKNPAGHKNVLHTKRIESGNFSPDRHDVKHLMWGTAKENAEHRSQDGSQKWERGPGAKIHMVTVALIKLARKQALSYRDIAVTIGVSENHTRAIVAGRKWANLPEEIDETIECFHQMFERRHPMLLHAERASALEREVSELRERQEKFCSEAAARITKLNQWFESHDETVGLPKRRQTGT